jgi:cytochrome c oxidase assembly protein subunit 16
MAVLPSRPLNPSRLNALVRKQPLFFGVPFVVLMVATSFGLSAITQTKYDLRDQRVKQVCDVDLGASFLRFY